MSSKTKFVIGGEHFATKKAVIERIRGIKDTADLGELTGADKRFCVSFFAFHPNVDKALNIAEVHVVKHPLGHRTFMVLKTDDEFVDISYQKPLRALTGLDSHKADVLLAMRQAIRPQIIEYREAAGTPPGEDYVVDHAYPHTFDALVREFLDREQAAFKDVQLVDRTDRLGKDLAGRWYEAWVAFHRERAVLRIVDRRENSRWGNRDPERYADRETAA